MCLLCNAPTNMVKQELQETTTLFISRAVNATRHVKDRICSLRTIYTVLIIDSQAQVLLTSQRVVPALVVHDLFHLPE